MHSDPMSHPFQSEEPSEINPGEETQRIAASIAKWQMFMSAMLMLGAVVMLAGMIISMLSEGDAQSAIVGILVFGAMLLIFNALPALLLFRASRRSSDYSITPNEIGFQGFAAAQLVFWRTLSIIGILGTAVWMLLIVIAIFGVALSV